MNAYTRLVDIWYSFIAYVFNFNGRPPDPATVLALVELPLHPVIPEKGNYDDKPD